MVEAETRAPHSNRPGGFFGLDVVYWHILQTVAHDLLHELVEAVAGTSNACMPYTSPELP